MPDIRLQPVESQDDMALLLQAGLDPLLIGDAQAHQFFIALHQMGHGSFGDRQAPCHQALMHLWDGAMLHKAPGSNQGNHIQAKFAMRQRPTSFFFGMKAHMIAWAGGSVTLTDNYSELEDAL